MSGSTKFKPLEDRVLVELINEEEKKSGLILPEEVKKQMEANSFRRAKVVAVGKKCEEVKENDVVLLKEEHGDKVNLSGNFYMIFKESYIFGIL